MLVRGGKSQTGRSYSNNGQKIVSGNIAINNRTNFMSANKTKLQAIDQLSVRKGYVKPTTEKQEPVHLPETPQTTMQSYSGFPSIQLESYYDRIQMKVMEFLCSFIVQRLTKELANSASQGTTTANKAIQCRINTQSAGSGQTERGAGGDENEIESYGHNNDDGKSIVETGIENYIAEQQIDQFIKKIMKVYKALRVLERNKSKDTPIFSRAIEKLIRYFSKAFPENCGIEGNLNDLNVSSHGQSTASNFYRSSTFHSEFSDFAEELREINMLADGKQTGGSSNNNFNFIDYSKISNDSNSVNADAGHNESKTELLGGLAQRRMSNEKSPSSNTFTNRGLDSSSNRRDHAKQPMSTIGAYRDLSQEELAVRIGGQSNQNDSKGDAKLDVSNNFDQFSHTSQMSQLSSQIVQESGAEVEAFSKQPRSLRKAGGGKWKRNQAHVKITQGILKTSSTQPLYQQMNQARGVANPIQGESPIIPSSKLNCDLQNIDHSAELPATSNNVQFADDLKVTTKKGSKSQQNKMVVENPQFNSQFGHALSKQNQLPPQNKTNYLRPVEEIFERKEMEEVDEDTRELDGQQQYSIHASPMAENLQSVQSWPHSSSKAAQLKNDSVYQTYSQIVSGQQSSMAQSKFLNERTKVISQQQQRSRSSTAKSQPNGVESLEIQQKLTNVNAGIDQNIQVPQEPFSVRIKNGKKLNLQGNYHKFATGNHQRLTHKSNTYQIQTQSRMNHQHIQANYQQPQVSRNKSSSLVKQSMQRSTQAQDIVLGSSDGEYINGTLLAQNVDTSVDQESVHTYNSNQVHARQNKKLTQRQQNGPGSYLNKRYSQAAYKSQPRTGLARDLGGSSSNQNINNGKPSGVFQTTKNSNYGINQKALSLVYTNQANMHNNMLMRQQQQLQQLYQFQHDIMVRNQNYNGKGAQYEGGNKNRLPEKPHHPQNAQNQQQFVTFNNTPMGITQGEQQVPRHNYEYEIGAIRNNGTESQRIPTILEDTEANELSHHDKTN